MSEEGKHRFPGEESSQAEVTTELAKPRLVTTESAKPLLVTTELAKPLLVTTESAKPLLVTTESAKPLLVTTELAKPLLVTTESAKPLLVTTESAKPLLVTTELAKPLLGVHAVILAFAIAASIVVWTRDKKPLAAAQGDVTVWAGRASALERVTYESKTRKVELVAKSDALGRYFVGTLEKDTSHAAVAATSGPPAKNDKIEEQTTINFVSVGPGEKLADELRIAPGAEDTWTRR